MFQKMHSLLENLSENILIFWAIGLTVLAFFPSILAFIKKHPNRRLVTIANILMMVTWVGWLAVLVWAATGRENERIKNFIKGKD